MGGKGKKPEVPPAELIQPGLAAKDTMLKLEPATRDLLKMLAAYRGETMKVTVHYLVVAEMERTAEPMKRQIDRLVEEAKSAPPAKNQLENE